MTETAVESLLLESYLDSFAELQAILAGLPMHAVPPPVFSRGCGPALGQACGGERRPPPMVDVEACVQRVRLALDQVCIDYPDRAEELRRLSVEHANLDLVCFADHTEGRLFTAVRGTDRMMNPLTTPRDFRNDVLILFGMPPWRTQQALHEYRAVRDRFPRYASYGSGHSLGGAIVENLAVAVEEEGAYRFCRIDVFNTGASPLRPAPKALTRTELHAHRVPGDWASVYYKPPRQGNMHTYEPKLHLRSRHALGHFLPEKASSKASASNAETAGGKDGELHDDEDEDNEEGRCKVQRLSPQFDAGNISLWMSLLSCAGLRKSEISRKDKCLPPGPPPFPSLRLDDSEDCWRNCAALGQRSTGPVEELQVLSPRTFDASGSQPLLRPPARLEDEDEDEDSDLEDVLPRHFITRQPEDAETFANLPTRLALAAALNDALASGEFVKATSRVVKRRMAPLVNLRACIVVQLDGSLASGELQEAVIRVAMQQDDTDLLAHNSIESALPSATV